MNTLRAQFLILARLLRITREISQRPRVDAGRSLSVLRIATSIRVTFTKTFED